jgi:hypothetical protein
MYLEYFILVEETYQYGKTEESQAECAGRSDAGDEICGSLRGG